MLLAIPYNPTLPGGYERLIGAFQRLGKHTAHTLIVLTSEAHEDGALALAMELKDVFGRHFSVTIQDQKEPMVKTSNRMFVAAMDTLKKHVPASSEMPEPVMLYFDPTWRPTQKRWLDEFQAEYYIAGAPTIYGYFKTKDEKARVEGPVAINVRFLKQTQLIDFIPDNVHWRDYLAWEMFNSGVKAPAFGKALPAYIRPYDS